MALRTEFITSGNLAYFQKYGERFISSFLAHVHPSITLKVYTECSVEGVGTEAYVPKENPRISFVDLFKATSIGAFLEKATPVVERKIGQVAATPAERLKSKSYDYRFDAVTFGKKVLTICHALQDNPAETVIWSDVDVVFYQDFGPPLLESLFNGKDIFYFGRADQHSETGIVGFHTAAKGVRELAQRMEKSMTDLSFTKLPGWTDCHVFDHVRTALEGEKKLSAMNLSKGQSGHVIARSKLAPYLDHMKGPLKFAGSSPERVDYLRKMPK
jgi:hypothetical protein